jgi:mitotic spindle assembly checkpoint protein MAD2
MVARGEITLRGSVAIITEFFQYAINNILFQRSIYPQSMFAFEKHYGLSLMMTTGR